MLVEPCWRARRIPAGAAAAASRPWLTRAAFITAWRGEQRVRPP